VLDHVTAAAELCAATFGALAGDGWSRRLVYNWPSPAEHDVAWLARHTLHEGVHHLVDVSRIVAGESC
jgi:S-DNA-T family DNA segregation ATPase FtsK/SpoIIIE